MASESPSSANANVGDTEESARDSLTAEIDTYEDLEEEAEEFFGEQEEDEDEEEEEAELPEQEEQEIEDYDEDDFKDDYFLEFREQYGPEETFKNLDSSNVQDLINMLAKVKLVWPEDLPHYDEQEYKKDPVRSNFPESFSRCTAKEKTVMWHAENFRRQFTHIFPDRRPLLIAPKNECGTQKLFPTFIHPTALGYPEFYEPETAGKFMKDFLAPQFFRPPTRVPRVIRSSVTILKDRKANSFEASVVLVSLLNGAGFDCYVVDGYATKEITTMCEKEDFLDVEDEDAPLKVVETDFEYNGEEAPEEKPEAQNDDDDDDDYDVFGRKDSDVVRPVSPSKYRVKAPKIYFSQYEKAMEKRAEEAAEEERLKAEKEAYEEMLRNQRPPTPDPLFGFRTHAWVMIMKGKRGVEENFFLEPFSGLRKEISDPNFLGIEAVFNEKNYYANIQDCSAGISDISYDLNDKSKWAKLLLEPPCRRSCKKVEDEEDDEEEGAPTASLFQEDDDEEAPPCEKYLDMPVSWTPELTVPQEDYERKYPQGSKVKDYNDAFVETAAPWVNSDGLIKKIIKFDGATRDPKRLLYIEERFAHRQDKVERRKWLKDGQTLHEFFEKGRKDSLKEHIHQSGKNKAHHPRHLYYYADAHPQNVSHREVVPNGLIEEFEGRDDLLYYRAIYYGGFLCHTIPAEEDPKIAKVRAMLDVMRGEEHGNKSKPRKKILRIDEKYHRNPMIGDADHDISEKYLFMAEGKIIIYFHYGAENFTRKSMEFFKPRGVKVDEVDFRPEDCVEFRVDPFSVPTSNYDKFLILKTLSKDELRAGSQARQAEDEIYHTVTSRIQEDWTHKMEPSPYTQIEQLQQRKEDEREDEEDFSTVDFATPYIEKYGKPATKRQEIALKQKIIKDARERIIKRAKAIQKEYDEESSKLKTKMEWYDRMKDSMSSEEDEEFQLFYNQALFRMHIMEQRLVRHREQAPLYFNKLLMEVLRHPVLNYFANRKISREEKQRRLVEKQAEDEEKKRLEALAKIPKDICCEYRFKFQDAKKSRVAVMASGVAFGGAPESTENKGANAPKVQISSVRSRVVPKVLSRQAQNKLSAANNKMSKMGLNKPSRIGSKKQVSKKKLK